MRTVRGSAHGHAGRILAGLKAWCPAQSYVIEARLPLFGAWGGERTSEGLLEHPAKFRCAAHRSTTFVATGFPYALGPVDAFACTGGEVPLHLNGATAQVGHTRWQH